MTMRIKKITVENFRQFSSIEVMLDEHLTVLVANNGCGKSTLIDAIALALEPFVSELADEVWYGIQRTSDVRCVFGPDGTQAFITPSAITTTATLGKNSYEWCIIRESLKARSKGYRTDKADSIIIYAASLKQAVMDFAQRKIETPPLLPVVVKYSTGRIWSDENGNIYSKKRREDSTRLQGYTDSLSPSASFGFFAQWFESFSREAQQETVSGRPSPHHPTQRLQAVRQAIQYTMQEHTGINDLSWDFVSKVVRAHTNTTSFPMAWLSDGIKSILAMVADIAHRCVRLNPQFGAEAAQKTPGIVLIDEVDMHLHPGWQQTILGSLQAAFPLIQFIVTTHSPQVLTTVPAECIRILSVAPDGMGHVSTPDRQTQGVGSASVLAQIQGVSPVPPLSIAHDLSTYTALIQQGQGESDAAKRLRTLLDAHFGADHPLILECDRLLRYQVFKVRLPSKGGS